MAVDLYQDDLSRLTDEELFRAIESFTRISEPISERPHEGPLLDLKECWSDRALHTVAGFAHSFGGVLLLGVSEENAQPGELVGVESRGEIKTRIASAIATNISPTPRYEIHECTIPGKPDRRLAVVRVREGNVIYYVTKKGDRPIYIRNEDESVPADAAQLRSLIERRTQAQGLETLSTELTALQNQAGLFRTPKGQDGAMPTNVKVILVPLSHPGIVLDISIEQQLCELVSRNFSHLATHDRELTELRSAADYLVDWYIPSEKFESVWWLDSRGNMIFTRQARVRGNLEPYWGLGDAIVDMLFFLAVARSLWKASGYYGEAHVQLSLLATQRLSVLPKLTADIWPAGPFGRFERNDFDRALVKSIVSTPSSRQSTARATNIFNSGLPYDGVTNMVAVLFNQLLRCLGHGTDLSQLITAIDICLHNLA